MSVLQMTSFSIKMHGCFFCSQSWHAVEQIIKRTEISDAMAFRWSHCNDNAAKRDFGITSDNVSNERMLMFSLLLARICCWTNTQVAGETTWHSCGVTVITMLQNEISVLQMISSPIKVFGIKVFGDFSCSETHHAVKEIVNRTVIWDAMALIWSHCNDNAGTCDFCITSDYVSIEKVLMFALSLARICRRTNNRVVGDLTLHEAHVGSL